MIFIGGYQPPTVAKATYFFVPKTSQNVICGKTIPQTTLPSNAAGILSNRGGSLRTAKSGRSGLMLFPKDGEHRQQIYILFSSKQPPKRCRNGLKSWKIVAENILELTSWKRCLASVSGYLYTYYGHDICVFLLTKI